MVQTAYVYKKSQISVDPFNTADSLALNDGTWLLEAENAMDNFRSTARAAKRRRRRVQQRLFEDGWC